MKEKLDEIRNCGGKYKDSKFKTFFGGIEIKECPVSFVNGWTHSIINEYFSLKQLKEFGFGFDIKDYSAKECESFFLIKQTLDKIELEREEKNRNLNKRLVR